MRIKMTEAELFQFYQDKFKPIYADLVVAEGEKFLEIDAQIESAMSHLALAKTSADTVVVQSNLESACGHVGRACLDAVKLLWDNRKAKVDKIMGDDLIRRFGGNASESRLWELHTLAERLAREARHQDTAGAGHNASELVIKYYDSVNTYQEILDSMDWEKTKQVEQFRIIYTIKQQLTGFLLGILAGIISSVLVTLWAWKYLPPSSPPTQTTIQDIKK